MSKILKPIAVSVFIVCLLSSSAMSFPSVFKKKQFSTLKDLKVLSAKIPELPESDSKNLVRPDYSSFYKSNEKSFIKNSWGKLKTFFRREKKPSWSPDVLKDLASSVAKYRVKNLKKLIKEENKIKVSNNTQLISFGNIHGSYHSFVRCLGELKSLGIIDNNLKILNSNSYVVFTGNVVGYSPFGMETLTAVLMLMKKNPYKVFFLKGRNESLRFWSINGFAQELQFKLKKTKEFVGFKGVLNKFFSTLPSSLYLNKKDGKVTRLVKFTSLFDDSKNKLNKNKLVDLYITGDRGFGSLDGKNGLRKVKSKSGLPVCKLFSAPNSINRKLRKFYNDSFVIFSIDNDFSKSTFNLYTKDSRKSDKFKKKVCCAFNNSLDDSKRYDYEIDRLNKKLAVLKNGKSKLGVVQG